MRRLFRFHIWSISLGGDLGHPKAAIRGSCGAVLRAPSGLSWAGLGPSWAVVGGVPGQSRAPHGRLEGLWGPCWAVLGSSGPSRSPRGPSQIPLYTFSRQLGALLGWHCAAKGRSWALVVAVLGAPCILASSGTSCRLGRLGATFKTKASWAILKLMDVWKQMRPIMR